MLEYLPRGDLEQLIRDGEGVRYGAADVKAWMAMLGRAVWFCHAHFVLHRDIKPNSPPPPPPSFSSLPPTMGRGGTV